MSTGSIEREIRAAANPAKAVTSASFFKTGKGEYGEGDVFLGLSVPSQRAIAKKYWQLPYADIEQLLASHIHEFRLTAVLILVARYEREAEARPRVYEFYLAHATQVNNWDLVDASAAQIVGEYLQDKPRKILYTLAGSRNLWERRIAIVSTYAFIRAHQFADTFAIAERLLADEHDLIHKATGWMLREVGKRSKQQLERFLRANSSRMPRTALRYAIERFPASERKAWLKRK